MPKKKVDDRIRTAIHNGVKTKTRTMLVIVGDRGKDQVVNLHYILSKAEVKARPSVLWCYKKELGFSTHTKKRMKQVKKQIARGLYDPDTDNPFDLFISNTSIRWCYYKDSHKILGQTFGMCVLQDFEALTPNLICRTIETVEGGGLIIVLLRKMSSLKQLYSMTMDAHVRFRTIAHQDVVPRFNERFMLSLASCTSCIVLDDELNILPISKHVRNITAIETKVDEDGNAYKTPSEKELEEVKHSLADSLPIGSLVALSKTTDQAKALLVFTEAIAEKSLKSTVALTAARGRGKSAALGLSIACAVAHGYSNIFITAPSPENLTTLFQFVFKGLDAIEFKEHLDYEIIQSTNPDFNGAVVRVNIFKTHRQTIQYIQPDHYEKLAQAELLIIDEAAAIPLPVVKQLLGNYLVFMASTITGYEGTGRALSLKLLQQLREKSVMAGARTLREVTLEEPIRYAAGDQVEAWLHSLLCLDVGNKPFRLVTGTPHPNECELYYVNRDALFSYHNLSEALLQRMMSLFVSSHYKNTPNDLQMMSDAPAHHLFALIGRVDESTNLPDVLCVVQVALEGLISSEHVSAQLAKGYKDNGDLIPWTVCEQFQDNSFAQMSGARVVRIATHPDVSGMGYGSRAIQLLSKYYQGDITSINEMEEEETKEEVEEKEDEEDDEREKKKNKIDKKKKREKENDLEEGEEEDKDKEEEEDSLLTKEKLKPRKKLPPLLVALKDRKAERLHWFGTSFGLTAQLYNFWSKAAYLPVYLRQTCNEVTGEHTVIMLKELNCQDLPSAPMQGWLDAFVMDMRKRFQSLLAFEFSKLPSSTALAILNLDTDAETSSSKRKLNSTEVSYFFSHHDLKRLEAYSHNMVDYHLIVDLLPSLARLFFSGRFGNELALTQVQRVLLLAQGLQNKSIDGVVNEMKDIKVQQLLALFNKSIRKLTTSLRSVLESEVSNVETDSNKEGTNKLTRAIGFETASSMVPLKESLDSEMKVSGKEAIEKMQNRQVSVLHSMNLAEYSVAGKDSSAWENALNEKSNEKGVIKTISVKKNVNSEDNKKEERDNKDKGGKPFHKGGFNKGNKREHGGGGGRGSGGRGDFSHKKQRFS